MAELIVGLADSLASPLSRRSATRPERHRGESFRIGLDVRTVLFLTILAYAGVVALVLGAIGLLRPIPRLGLDTRRRALGLAIAGVACCSIAVCWPTALMRAPRVASALDEVMPAYQFVEHHQTTVRASPRDVFDAIRRVTAGEIRYFYLLTWIRNPHVGRRQESILSAPADKPILDVALGGGFVLLKDIPDQEIVVGATVGRGVKAVMNFYVRPGREGQSLLSTETRVFADSDRGRRAFAAYWRFIYPGSALIRIEWLRAIQRRAEATSK
jgi:hypothetical protein